MTLAFRPAARTKATPLVGLYGESGSGKTYSALLLARGFVGPEGKIAMIDTESGRGEIYADVIDGGYDVLPLEAPFSPQRYVEAINVAEQAGYAMAIIDSASHEWEGIGGVLAQADAEESRTGKPGLHCWKRPKAEHQKFVLKMLQSKIPVILCLRAKHKTRQVRGRSGRMEVVKDDHTSPIQAEDFIYEMTVHAEVMRDHTLRVTKCSHPGLQSVFTDGRMINVDTGARLSAWAKEGAEPTPNQEPAKQPDTQPDIGFDDDGAGNSGDALDAALELLTIAASHSSAELRRTWGDVLTKEQRTLVGADGLAEFKATAERSDQTDDEAA